MTPEKSPDKQFRATITTGEISPEVLARIVEAVGKVVAIDSLQITKTKIKPPEEEPSYLPVPEQLKGRLGKTRIDEFMTIAAAQGRDLQFAVKLWNSLAGDGLVTREIEAPGKNLNISNLRAKIFRGSTSTEEAADLGDSVDLNVLSELLVSGQIGFIPYVGNAGEQTIKAVIQHRVSQILSQAQADQAGTDIDPQTTDQTSL